MLKRCVFSLFLLILAFCGLLSPSDVSACGSGGYNCDPCLIIYPTYPTTYCYDPTVYYTVTTGHPLYDPIYDRGGKVLISDRKTLPDVIAYEIYQAPQLVGFEKTTGYTGFYFTGMSFDLVIDGWSAYPTTRNDIELIFEPIPTGCSPAITVDGVPIVGPPYGVSLGDLLVSTPVTTPARIYYSDTITKSIAWSGCIGLFMYAFEDCDRDHHWLACGECEEEDNCCFHCHQMCANGAVVPVRSLTWGAIKSLFE